MSLKYLGNGFDFHGGGVDLVFPIMKTKLPSREAFTGEPPFARCWVHNGLLQVKDEKMSKSLGNFTPLTDLLAKVSCRRDSVLCIVFPLPQSPAVQ